MTGTNPHSEHKADEQDWLDDLIEDAIEFGHRDYSGAVRSDAERQSDYQDILDTKAQILAHYVPKPIVTPEHTENTDKLCSSNPPTQKLGVTPESTNYKDDSPQLNDKIVKPESTNVQATPESDYSTLPRDKMKKVTIAFDVDGTLRCNCTDTCDSGNQRIYDLFTILATFKNIDLYVWSGGGADYARRFADKLGLPVKPSRCISKFDGFKPDIAIDDIQETALGTLNLIVKEK